MAQNKLEGRRFVGVIVGGGEDDPDPRKMGRVRVAVPQFMSPNVNPKDLPWVQLASTANDSGPITFDRPPQEGTLVSIYFPYGSKSSMRGIVEYVYNGIHNVTDVPENTSLPEITGWFKDAINKQPQINGLPDIQQVIEDNITGVEKVTTELVNKLVPTMKERYGIPSQLTFKSLVRTYDDLKNVATAAQQSAAVMTSDIAARLPGVAFNLVDMLTSEVVSKVIDKLPREIKLGLTALSSVQGSSEPRSGTNFLQTALRINPESFFSNAANALKNVGNFSQLEEALDNIKNNPDIAGLGDLVEELIEISGPFGKILQRLTSTGDFEAEIDEIVEEAISAMLSFFGSVISATGAMLENSEIMEKMVPRLPVNAQREFITKMQEIPTAITSSLNKSNSYLGSN